ncbi:MAG: hypothetical protein U1E05_07910 [Patescibacteria group bacterium]|nr:hypothetical protein [Patescibacteria group bacterium]
MMRYALAPLAGAVLLMVCGCGRGDGFPPRVQVEVSVTYKGSPVAEAHVTFAPTGDGGSPAFGTTGPDGKVLLSTFGDSDGALPGAYQVGIRKTQIVSGAAAPADDPMAMPSDPAMNRPTEFKELLPARYAAPAQSELVATVAEGSGQNSFLFELRD